MEWETIDEIILDLATRFRKIRKSKKISQIQLSKMSNVSYGTIKRFELTGEISLYSLTKLCVALDIRHEIKNMFTNIEFKSADEVIRYGR